MRILRLLRPAACLAALVLFAALTLGGAHRAEAILEGSCQPIDFDSVSFEDGGRRGWYLYIGGTRRFANMNVVLDHKPASRGNWIIRVVGCTKNALVLPIPTPFSIEVPMRKLPPGIRRVTIVGAGGSVRRNVPGR
jgi:hypothetical protein